MSGKSGKLLTPYKSSGAVEHESLFRKRQQAVGIAWTDVDWVLWLKMLAACTAEGIGVGIYPASGGRGICLKLYRGRKMPDTEYANTSEELNFLLAGVVEGLGYGDETQATPVAAD